LQHIKLAFRCREEWLPHLVTNCKDAESEIILSREVINWYETRERGMFYITHLNNLSKHATCSSEYIVHRLGKFGLR
jgi:hypothetical protein